MNGALLKLAVITIAFFSTISFATNTKMFSSKMGCMTCHQAESIQPDKITKKNRNHLHRKHPIQTVLVE